ncbi:Predicted HNH nuclease [Halomonas sp. A3H3]|uniref:HNH endonuclease n=1 Tax=unclassified Halomonas TaxID=2609666 RepID=UPI00038D9184|nr:MULTISPECIES: HNH endonuclease signature motif containing protein [unclassified Halomonas]CDG54585.1 Predicted HNH nuclease [Halomonas sp. A3H3]
MQNRHGLNRKIPEGIKREVRKACGYGCVICGAAIVEYEHVDPVFSDAHEHSPDGIVLLCPQCHAKKTRGFLSPDRVKEAKEQPISQKKNFAHEFFDLGSRPPAFVLGGCSIKNTPIPLEIHGYPVIKIEPSREEGGPALFSGTFFNSRGELSLQIIENEWRALSNNWDFEAIGGGLIVRDAPRSISLRLRASSDAGIIVEAINMRVGAYQIIGDETDLLLRGDGGLEMHCGSMIMHNCPIGFSLG